MAHAAVPNNLSSRTRLLVFPREHGAWGMLFVPLATGAVAGLMAGGRVQWLLPLLVAAFALFCLRTPVESLLGTSPMRAQTSTEKLLVGRYIAGFAGIAVVGMAVLFWAGYGHGLSLLALATGLLFLAQSLLRRLGRRWRMMSQVIGAAGLTISASAAYYITTGRFGAAALGLWLANWTFAGNQIHFVQVRIHGATLSNFREKFASARGFMLGQLVMWAVLVAACFWRLLPWLALVAFVPVFVRGSAWFFRKSEKLDVRRVGFTELAHALIFGMLLLITLTA